MLGKFRACVNSVYQAFSFAEGLGTRLLEYMHTAQVQVRRILWSICTQPKCRSRGSSGVYAHSPSAGQEDPLEYMHTAQVQVQRILWSICTQPKYGSGGCSGVYAHSPSAGLEDSVEYMHTAQVQVQMIL